MPRTYSSRRNGHGIHGWHNHWLLAPLYGRDGELTGVIWADDPMDHLIPARETLQALRLFADQAATGFEATRRAEQLREMAERDALTGLANRRALRAYLSEHAREGFALLTCDLDRFKRLNDSLGHEAGDSALVQFADLMSALARPSDLVVRLGGEEFGLVLPDASSQAAYGVAERLVHATREHFAGLPGGLTVSVGVAACGPHVASPDGTVARQVLRDADEALYAAKRAGRDRVMVHGESRGSDSEPTGRLRRIARRPLEEWVDASRPHRRRHFARHVVPSW